MSLDKHAFIAFLVDTGAVKFGDFTLKSGERSPFFVDLGCIKTGRELTLVGDAMAQGLAQAFPQVTLLFGPAYKGIVLATAVAQGAWRTSQKELGVCFNRKEAKAHGEKGLFFGQLPVVSDHVVIIDDVLSSGGTKLEAAAALQQSFGLRAEGVLVALDRTRKHCDFDRHALPVQALVSTLDLAAYLQAQGDHRAAVVRAFYEGQS